MLTTESARGLVMRRVEAQAARFPDFDLEAVEARGLDERDARLAMAIEHLVARRWLTLAAALDRCLARPGSWTGLEPAVKSSLLCGAAQMLLMDRVPDHAAINEAVEWVKQRKGKGAGGLVNAVLRRVSRMRGAEKAVPLQWHGFEKFDDLPRAGIVLGNGRIRALSEDVFAEEPLARAAQQCSVPPELLTRWVEQLGEKDSLAIAMHGLVEAPVIVAMGGGAKPQATMNAHQEAGFFVFGGSHEELEEFLGRNPGARVQDPSSAMAVEMIRGINPAPQLIVDFCAGRGTKTRQLAEAFPQARVIASDVNAARLAELRDASADESRIEAVSMNELNRFRGQADLLVLDVPCSNSGVLARRVEAKYRFSRESLDSLVKLQREIVKAAMPLLREGGFVLYATCSLEPQENQQQAEWMLREMGLEMLKQESRSPRGTPGEPAAAYCDGSFAELLKAGRAG